MAEQAPITLEQTGVTVPVEGASQLFLDAPAGCVLAATPSTVACHPVAGGTAQVIGIGEGPPVAAAALSLDGAFLAVQRSPSHIQVVSRLAPGLFVQAPQKGRLLGFLWTSSPQVDLVMVTNQGVELYKVQKDKQGLKAAGRHPITIAWWRYSHPARLLLLGTGDIGLWLQAYQLAAEGPIKLPPFQISAVTPRGTSSPPARSALSPDDLAVVTLYGGIYAAFLDRKACHLFLYRFFRDNVELQHTYNLPGPGALLLTTDSLLLAYDPASGHVSVVDVKLPDGQLLGTSLPLCAHEWQELPSVLERCRWKHQANILFDVKNGVLWRLRLDVCAAAAAEGVSAATGIACLLRRNPASFPGSNLPGTVTAVLKRVLVEQQPLDAVGEALEATLAGLPAQPGAKGQQAGRLLTLQDVIDLLRSLHKEAAVPGQYLRAALAELRAAAVMHSTQLPPALNILDLEAAVQLGQGSQVASMLSWQPACASVDLAAAIQAHADSIPQAGSVSARMLQACGAHELATRALLDAGRVAEAARYAQQHALAEVEPQEFQLAAERSGQAALAKALQRSTVLSQRAPVEQGMLALTLSRQSSELPISSLPAKSLVAV